MKIISQFDDDSSSSLDAYVVDTNQEQLENYLSEYGTPKNIIDTIRQKYQRIAIFRNLWVDEDQRHRGIGTSLFEAALDDATDNDAQAIILVSDTTENNDFDLTEWYAKYGFEQIAIVAGYPLMLLEL